jgi:hypothetical protein
MKYLVFALVLAVSCSSSKKEEDHSPRDVRQADDTSMTLKFPDSVDTEDFMDFYSKFLKDSIFQMSRIRFPLEGRSVDGDKISPWSIDNWVTLKTSVFEVDTAQYKVEITESDTLKIFRVYIPNSGFEVLSKFGLIDGKWYLIYYDDIFT